MRRPQSPGGLRYFFQPSLVFLHNLLRLKMTISNPEHDLDEFASWEIRGRGWLLWPHLVELEPPFRPLPLPGKTPADDVTWEEPPPPVLSFLPELRTYELTLPAERSMEVRGLINACAEGRFPLAIELHSSASEISICAAMRAPDVEAILNALGEYAPCVRLEPATDPFDKWNTTEKRILAVAEWALEAEFLIPLIDFTRSVDSANSIHAPFQTGDDDTLVSLQILFQRAKAPWAESIHRIRTRTGSPGGECTSRDLLPKTRVGDPLISVAIRTAVLTTSTERACSVVSDAHHFFGRRPHPCSNTLIPAPPASTAWFDLRTRTTHRSGMLLTPNELAQLLPL